MAEYPKVRTVTGKFMVLSRDHVHAYIVELENSVIIDSTLSLPKAEATGKPIEAHGHSDHYTGLAVFEDLPRYASQGCLDFAHEEDDVKSGVAKQYLGDQYSDKRVFPNEIIEDGAVLTFDGVDFTFTDLGLGESPSDGRMFEKDGLNHAFVGDSVASQINLI